MIAERNSGRLWILLAGALTVGGIGVVALRRGTRHRSALPPAQPRYPTPWVPPHVDPAPPSITAPPRVAIAIDPSTRPSVARAPSLAEWALALAPGVIAHPQIQLPYALKWIDIESGGSPCAVGHPAAKGPDGNPRELGIAQFYNPDDLQRLGMSGTELRAYCVPGLHDITYKGKIIKGFSGALARPLTYAEKQRQADGAIGLILASMGQATHDLTGVGAGPAWAPSTRDYWRLVKLQHGLPSLSSHGLAAVTARLGHPPTSWQEFKAGIADVTLDANTEGHRWTGDPATDAAMGPFGGIFANAERCADAYQEAGVG